MLLRMPNTQPDSVVMTSVSAGSTLCWSASTRNDRLQFGVLPAL